MSSVPRVLRRAPTVSIDVPNASSDGGAILRQGADRRLGGPISRLENVLVDAGPPGKPKPIDERIGCPRGEIEDRIRELFEVALDRTRCSRFLANPFRVRLAAAADVLRQEIRLGARDRR